MQGINAQILLTQARELYPKAGARILSDNGSQFIKKDFEELVSFLEFEHTRTSANHPQSNTIVGYQPPVDDVLFILKTRVESA
jgi:transposase InsO family protein